MSSGQQISGRGCKPLPIKQRFDRRIIKSDGCWLWRGGKGNGGKAGPPGRMVIKGKHRGVRRVSYELHVGPIPDGFQVLVSCDNPWCIHPDHLVLGQSSGGSHLGGADSPRAKLTEAIVEEIRTRAAQGESHASLGKEFGISRVHAWRIVKGASWNVSHE